MQKEKKKWETPKLICLHKGRPEEAVLMNCKNVNNETGPLGAKCQQQPQGNCEIPAYT